MSPVSCTLRDQIGPWSAIHQLGGVPYGRFDLGDQTSYRSFLESHARAVLPIEVALAGSKSPMQWRSRISHLEDALKALGGRLPAVAALTDLKGSGERAGKLYVVEGSRLGGGVLADRVGAFFPVSYLSACTTKGSGAPCLPHLTIGQRPNQRSGWLKHWAGPNARSHCS